MSCLITKPTKWYVRPAKTQIRPPSLIRVYAVRTKKAMVLSYPLSAQLRLIRLGGRPGWSESSQGAQSFYWFCREAAQMAFNFHLSKRYTMSVYRTTLGPGFGRTDGMIWPSPQATHVPYWIMTQHAALFMQYFAADTLTFLSGVSAYHKCNEWLHWLETHHVHVPIR